MAMIYIIGNHKQCIVYNDCWFEFVKHFATVLTMELYPRWRKYLEGHVG